ncbi:MAG: TonB family protein [Rhizobacter sp.]|nr:TonB family protein [Chlorobiales bacterium]
MNKDLPYRGMLLKSTLAMTMMMMPICATAQGRLIGRVMDKIGDPVAATTVYVSGATTKATLSNAQGYYTLLDVPEGDYTIKASKRGLPDWGTKVSIASNYTVRLDIRLGESDGKTTQAIAISEADRKAQQLKLEKLRLERERLKEAQPKEQLPGASVPPPPAISKEEQDAIELQKLADKQQSDFAVASAIPEHEVEIDGGIEMLYKKIKYPEAAKKIKVEGQVVARVYVDEQGDATDVEILKGANDLFNDEVFRVLSEDIKFKPAKALGGKAVKGTMIIPITFKLGSVDRFGRKL